MPNGPTGSTVTVFHALTVDSLPRFVTMPGPSGAIHPQLGRNFMSMMATGHYRPQWTWVAEQDGMVVARAAWWGSPQASHPSALDWLDLPPGPHGVAVGADLLRHAHTQVRTGDGRRPEFHLFLPDGWARLADAKANRARMAAARRAGLTAKLDRWHLTWLSDRSLPTTAGRLHYRSISAEDDALLLHLLHRILQGTLDFYSAEDIAAQGIDETARRDLEYLGSFQSPREWWRLGTDGEGTPVGVVMPARNSEHAIIAYLGVVPEKRGNGYGLDLLLEGTRTLRALGIEEIHADTDVSNTPMAAAFRAAGYRFSVHKVLRDGTHAAHT